MKEGEECNWISDDAQDGRELVAMAHGDGEYSACLENIKELDRYASSSCADAAERARGACAVRASSRTAGRTGARHTQVHAQADG